MCSRDVMCDGGTCDGACDGTGVMCVTHIHCVIRDIQAILRDSDRVITIPSIVVLLLVLLLV